MRVELLNQQHPQQLEKLFADPLETRVEKLLADLREVEDGGCGIYFASDSTKSARYARTALEVPIGKDYRADFA